MLGLSDRVARRHGEPTEFELLTAVVFARFAEVRPDVALVEVGLGGRLDATHAWDGGVVGITNVYLDHMDRLGPKRLPSSDDRLGLLPLPDPPQDTFPYVAVRALMLDLLEGPYNDLHSVAVTLIFASAS